MTPPGQERTQAADTGYCGLHHSEAIAQAAVEHMRESGMLPRWKRDDCQSVARVELHADIEGTSANISRTDSGPWLMSLFTFESLTGKNSEQEAIQRLPRMMADRLEKLVAALRRM